MPFHAIGAARFQSKPNINPNIGLARKSLYKQYGTIFPAACAKAAHKRFKRNESMRSKTAIEIYAYWDELRGHRDVPARSQIEPAHIRNILADLFILEKTPRGDIRFRLAGTRVCALFARELRGSTFDALWLAEQTSRLARIARDVMTQKAPVVLTASALAGTADRLPTEIILLPLRSPDGNVDRIIGALAPLSKPHWLGATPVNFLDLGGIRVLDTEKTNVFLQNRPEIPLPAVPSHLADQGIAGAIRRVLHLRVFEGGRRD
jgi:hypothetical protein